MHFTLSFGESISLSEEIVLWGTKQIMKREKRYLFQFVEDFVGIGEVPVEKKLVDDREIVSGFWEAWENLFYVTLSLLLNQAPDPREEPGLSGGAFEPGIPCSLRKVTTGVGLMEV